MFGCSDDEWDSLLDNAITVLKRETERRRMTSYSELNAELVRPHPAGVGYLRPTSHAAEPLCEMPA